MKKDKVNSTESVTQAASSLVDRFDLEQQIMQCWNIVDDVRLFANQEAPSDEFIALAKVYHRKFETLFDTFEQMMRTGQFTNIGSK